MYDIKGFTKLYGETVIESHNLLKSGIELTDYMLVTEDYMKALQQNISDVLVSDFEYNSYTSQLYSGVKKIAYYFFSTVKKAAVISKRLTEKALLNDDMYVAVGTSTL